MTRTSWLLTVLLLAFNLALVAWWTWFQVGEARRLELAGEHLVAERLDAAARALGAADAESLPGLAASRRRMFLSEGIAFAVIVVAGGAVVLLTLRREARLRKGHDRFLAGATHELRTPLATIRLLLESLRDERVPAGKRARYLQSGLLEAARLEAGLTNVLTAAGLRATEPRRIAPVPGDLAEDVRRALARLRPRAEAAGVELVAADLPAVPAVRDPEAVQLVLHNLLDNAIKFSPAGRRVDLRLSSTESLAVLTVRDHGAGMDAETRANAFVPFWRGRDQVTGGTGLGLHLVRELVRAHGGSIEVQSAGAGQGSEFTVRLPRRGGGA